MSRIHKERDRLLSVTARNVGLTATATALLCLSVPGTLPLPLFLASLRAARLPRASRSSS